MSFWENLGVIFWWFFCASVFVAYLFALFAVIGDLFRDHKLNGWWKAVWILFLIFLPFLSLLVYLVARGEGMAMRSVGRGRHDQAGDYEYIHHAAMTSPADEITEAKALLDAGTISAADFEQIRSKVIR